MELICGACHGRLLVELPGSTVACPHCGTHLQTPAAEPAPYLQGVILETGDSPASGPDPDTDTVRMNLCLPQEPMHEANISPEAFAIAPPIPAATAAPADAAPVRSGAPDVVAADTVAPDVVTAVSAVQLPVPSAKPGDLRSESPVAVVAAENSTGASARCENAVSAGEGITDAEKTTVVGLVAELGQILEIQPAITHEVAGAEHAAGFAATTDGFSSGPGPALVSAHPAPAGAMTSLPPEPFSSPQPADKAPGREPVRAGVSPRLFMLVVSYASAMTLACLYLAFLLLSNPRTHDLPDLAPPTKDKKSVTSLIYVSPDQELPPANVLKLGESRQYGSLRITALRVTRGPLVFEYYEAEADQHREPEGPVLKLHLRFENVSRDQEFIPLDSKLVFTKKVEPYGQLKANNFVCNVSDRKKPAKLVFVFDLTPNGNWLLKGENLDREFEPGQALETFIPTTPEQIDSLSGDLVWRVHFRKGYNPKSFRGVTTLIEVLFKTSDIVDEEEPATADPAPGEREPDHPEIQGPAFKDA